MMLYVGIILATHTKLKLSQQGRLDDEEEGPSFQEQHDLAKATYHAHLAKDNWQRAFLNRWTNIAKLAGEKVMFFHTGESAAAAAAATTYSPLVLAGRRT